MKTIEKIIYRDQNDIYYNEIYTKYEYKIKINIKSNDYDFQCHAIAYLFKDGKWNNVYSIPYTLMKTPAGLGYKNIPLTIPHTETLFIDDVIVLKDKINEIIT